MEMKNEFEVFDFNEEDEISESTADKYSSKFKNPNFDDPAKVEYRFLECVADGVIQRKEPNDSACVDVDAVDGECSYDGATPAALQGTDRKDPIPKEGSYEHDVSPESKYMHGEQQESRRTFPEQELRDSCAEASSPGISPLNNALHNPPLSNEPVDLAADFNASMSEISASSTASDIAEDDVSLNDNVSDHCFGNIIEDDLKGNIVICWDYVLYQGNYYTGGSAIFSPDGIKIKGTTESECQVTFSFERGIDDIMSIDCQWFQRFAHMVVNLKVLSMAEAENACGLSVVEELKFAVNDPRWSEKQEAITSLNVKYLAIWNIMIDYSQMIGMDGDESPQHKSYFPNFDKPFEEVVYPKGDFDAVSISKRDVDLLQPETFINDTIVDFYIKYLKNQIQPEEGQRFHFFNSFFFRKLADLDKDPSSISDGRAAFLRVRKWTRKLDMFGKDYIFVPVNFSLHWSLIVICHPGEVAAFKDEDLDKSSKVPCILHMDSIKGNHAGLKNLVQSYLWEEWKERHKEASEDLSSKFLNLRFVSLELPQQENSFDCGLFLLHYLELFLADAPHNFNPFKITKYSNFLNLNWFPPTEASLKRTLIQKLIFELLETHSQENSSSDCSGEPHCSKVPEKIENETGVEFISENLCQGVTCHGNLNSQAGQGIEMTLLASSSMRHMGNVNDSGLVLREFFEPGTTTGSLLGQFQSFEQPSSYYNLNGAISPTEQDDVQTGQQYVYLASGENGFSQFTGMTPQAEVPYSSRGFVLGSSWNHEISMQGDREVDSSFEETSCASDDDENDDDVGIIENIPIQDNVEPSEKWEADQLVENVDCLKKGSVPPASSEALETSNSDVSEASEGTRIHHSTEFADLPSKDNPPLVLHQTPGVEVNQVDQDSELVENNEARDVHMIGDAMVNDLPSEDNSTVSLHQNPGTVLNQLHQDSELAGKTTETAENNDDRDNDVKISGDPVVGDNVENEARDVPMIDDAMANDLPPEENLTVSSHQNPGTIVNRPDQDSENKEAIGDELLSETAEQPAAKKIRLTPPEDKED